MKNQPKIRKAMLVAALAAVTATAWATNESLSNSTWVPYSNATAEATPAATQAEPVDMSDTLAPNESVMAPSDSTAAPVAPRENIAMPSAPQPPITIEERRLSLDERIQANVIDRLASAENLSGKIGVESNDAVVTLTGYTITAGQARRAGREARSVEGVRDVQNEIRPRIGGSV